MKRYDAWIEPEEAQRGYTTGSSRVDLLEKTMGKYVTFDDHEREVSAIRAELARVKAESLRVVVVPDEGNLYDWYMTPTGLGYPGKDRKNNNCIESAEGYHRLDECKPVRLERWEDE